MRCAPVESSAADHAEFASPRPATRPLPSHRQSIRRWLPHLRRRPNTPVASFPFQGACLLGTWLPLNGPLLLLAALTVRLAGPITHFIPPDPALHMHLHGGSLYSLHSLDWAPQPNLAIPGSLSSSAFLVLVRFESPLASCPPVRPRVLS